MKAVDTSFHSLVWVGIGLAVGTCLVLSSGSCTILFLLVLLLLS